MGTTPTFGGTLTPGQRPAVVVIDLMRAYFDTDSPFCLPSTSCLDAAAQVLSSARAAGVLVVHTRVEFAPGGVDGGLFLRKVGGLSQLIGPEPPMGEVMAQVVPADGEPVIVKQYASAFFGTSLASTLVSSRIDTVILVGVTTSGCIRASAVDAMQYGFVPLVVRDAVADRDCGPHEANLYDLQAKYAEVVDLSAALRYLEGL